MNVGYPVPDTRFEQTFKRALVREAERQRASQWKKMGLNDPQVISQLQKIKPPNISKLVVCKVVFRDVFLMPFVQGIIWTTALIALKPWLGQAVAHGRRMGSALYRIVLGPDLVKKSKRV